MSHDALTSNLVPTLRDWQTTGLTGCALAGAAADEIDRLTERLAGAYASVTLLTEMLESRGPQEATEIHRIALDGLNGNDVYAYAALTKIAMATDPSLSAPHEPSGWQPIETAPKDGSEFQAWVIYATSGVWEPRCRYNEHGAFQVWQRVDYDLDGWDTVYGTQTHWMPLPSAPVTKSAALCRRCSGSGRIEGQDIHGFDWDAPCPVCAPKETTGNT